MPSLPSPDAPFCKCDDPNCPAGPLMRKMNEMPTDGEAWEIENVSGLHHGNDRGGQEPLGSRQDDLLHDGERDDDRGADASRV